MDKITARKTAKERVSALTPQERFDKSAIIAETLQNYIDKKGYKNAFIYMSVSGEVSTLALMSNLFVKKLDVYIPRVYGDDMLVTKIDEKTTYTLNKYKIPEAELAGEERYDLDVNIIPCIAYDKNFNRAGHGKGYYDRFLSKVTGEIIMLAFSEQEVEFIETNELDVKPDIIITEKGIITRK